MFAWIYLKDDKWVKGTVSNKNSSGRRLRSCKTYENLMKKIVKKIKTSAKRQMKRLSLNNELEKACHC